MLADVHVFDRAADDVAHQSQPGLGRHSIKATTYGFASNVIPWLVIHGGRPRFVSSDSVALTLLVRQRGCSDMEDGSRSCSPQAARAARHRRRSSRIRGSHRALIS